MSSTSGPYPKALQATVVTTKMATDCMEVALADVTGLVKLYCYRKDLMTKMKDTFVIRNFTKGRKSDCLFMSKMSRVNLSMALCLPETQHGAAEKLLYPPEAEKVTLSDIDIGKHTEITVTGEIVSVSLINTIIILGISSKIFISRFRQYNAAYCYMERKGLTFNKKIDTF